MISYLTGEVVEEGGEFVTVDVNGVGYQIYCSQNSLDHFFAQKKIQAWVYTQVREDAITLFGFSSKKEKKLFEELISVNGVGPKLAVKILSGGTTEKIAQLIDSADVAGLTQIPKVGKKTAEQIVLTLKGKLQIHADEKVNQGNMKVLNQIQSALLNLGFRAVEVEKILQTMPAEVNFSEGVKEALAQLSRN